VKNVFEFLPTGVMDNVEFLENGNNGSSVENNISNINKEVASLTTYIDNLCECEINESENKQHPPPGDRQEERELAMALVATKNGKQAKDQLTQKKIRASEELIKDLNDVKEQLQQYKITLIESSRQFQAAVASAQQDQATEYELFLTIFAEQQMDANSNLQETLERKRKKLLKEKASNQFTNEEPGASKEAKIKQLILKLREDQDEMQNLLELAEIDYKVEHFNYYEKLCKEAITLAENAMKNRNKQEFASIARQYERCRPTILAKQEEMKIFNAKVEQKRKKKDERDEAAKKKEMVHMQINEISEAPIPKFTQFEISFTTENDRYLPDYILGQRQNAMDCKDSNTHKQSEVYQKNLNYAIEQFWQKTCLPSENVATQDAQVTAQSAVQPTNNTPKLRRKVETLAFIFAPQRKVYCSEGRRGLLPPRQAPTAPARAGSCLSCC